MGTWISAGIALMVAAGLAYVVRPQSVAAAPLIRVVVGILSGGILGMLLSSVLSPTAGMSVPSFWGFIYAFWGALAGFVGALIGIGISDSKRHKGA